MVRLCEFEMSALLKDSVWEEFDRADVNGRSVAVCKICQRQVAANRGVMCMHFRTQHCKPSDGSRQSDAIVDKPLSEKPKASAPRVTERCSIACQNRMNGIPDYASDAEDMHSNGSESATNLRRRRRTLLMLRYLADAPSDEAYASIIANANGQIIRTIRSLAHAYVYGTMSDLSPVESLALGRYRESMMDRLTGYGQSMEDTRNALLKPRRKPRKPIPESTEYVPMLLALALARDELETHVDNADAASTDEEEDGSDDSDNILALLTGDEDSSDGHHSNNSEDSEESGDGHHSSNSEDSEDSSNDASEDTSEHASEDSGDPSDDANRYSSAGEEASTEQSSRSDEGSEEASTEQSEQSDEGSEESEEDDEETDDEEAEDSEDSEDEDEEVEDSEDEDAEDSEDEDAEDSEDEDEEDCEDEDEEDSEDEQDSEDNRHYTKSLKRRRAEQSDLQNLKRRRFYY